MSYLHYLSCLQSVNFLDISRDPVLLPKSLQILSEQKLITQRQGKGTFVNSIHRPQRRLGIIIQSQNYFNDVYFLQLLVLFLLNPAFHQ